MEGVTIVFGAGASGDAVIVAGLSGPPFHGVVGRVVRLRNLREPGPSAPFEYGRYAVFMVSGL